MTNIGLQTIFRQAAGAIFEYQWGVPRQQQRGGMPEKSDSHGNNGKSTYCASVIGRFLLSIEIYFDEPIQVRFAEGSISKDIILMWSALNTF